MVVLGDAEEVKMLAGGGKLVAQQRGAAARSDGVLVPVRVAGVGVQVAVIELVRGGLGLGGGGGQQQTAGEQGNNLSHLDQSELQRSAMAA